MTHLLHETKREDLFPKNTELGLKASASTNLNPHAIYSKQFLKDKKLEQLSEKHMKRRFNGLGKLLVGGFFKITSLFCLRHTFRDDVIDFYSNLGNYSFLCIHWTAYFLRIHYHSFKSYWIVLSKNQKAMASLPFIFYWRKHIFLMAIQKYFFFIWLS